MKYLALLALFTSLPAFAEIEGYDWDTGNYIDIEAKTISEGDRNVTVYDHDTGAYHNVDVESVNRYGLTVEVEVYDHTTNEYRTLDLEK